MTPDERRELALHQATCQQRALRAARRHDHAARTYWEAAATRARNVLADDLLPDDLLPDDLLPEPGPQGDAAP